MPREITNPDEFLDLSKNAVECRVTRKGDIVKLKLRTHKQLYTLKISPKEAEGLLGKISCTVVEI
ncbi:MAG: hypothetical protein ACW976_05610 [Candidatus Ranarchaeia archaeon]|jgi:hypothetical protein